MDDGQRRYVVAVCHPGAAHQCVSGMSDAEARHELAHEELERLNMVGRPLRLEHGGDDARLLGSIVADRTMPFGTDGRKVIVAELPGERFSEVWGALALERGLLTEMSLKHMSLPRSADGAERFVSGIEVSACEKGARPNCTVLGVYREQPNAEQLDALLEETRPFTWGELVQRAPQLIGMLFTSADYKAGGADTVASPTDTAMDTSAEQAAAAPPAATEPSAAKKQKTADVAEAAQTVALDHLAEKMRDGGGLQALNKMNRGDILNLVQKLVDMNQAQQATVEEANKEKAQLEALVKDQVERQKKEAEVARDAYMNTIIGEARRQGIPDGDVAQIGQMFDQMIESTPMNKWGELSRNLVTVTACSTAAVKRAEAAELEAQKAREEIDRLRTQAQAEALQKELAVSGVLGGVPAQPAASSLLSSRINRWQPPTASESVETTAKEQPAAAGESDGKKRSWLESFGESLKKTDEENVRMLRDMVSSSAVRATFDKPAPQ